MEQQLRQHGGDQRRDQRGEKSGKVVFGATVEHMVRTSMVIRNASITELKFRSNDFAWHPERISLLSFNATHHLPTELHTEY